MAARIINFFRGLRERLTSVFRRRPRAEPVCVQETIDIGNDTENLYMYFNKKSGSQVEEVPLFNLFNFSSKEGGISDSEFFNEFHKRLLNELRDWDFHNFYIIVKEDRSVDFLLYSDPSEKPGEKKTAFTKRREELGEYYRGFVEEWILPYLLYVLANCKITLNPGDLFTCEILNPDTQSDQVGFIHKDDDERTCITYLESPVSTELAFDLDELGEQIDLSWMTCSPVFRFDTSQKLYTLCFNDKFMLHTVPVWEYQEFDDDYKYAEENEHIIHTSLDTEGNPIREFKFTKPTYREKIGKPDNRRIITCFISTANREDIEESERFKRIIGTYNRSVAQLDQYKMSYREEKVELSKEIGEDILTKKIIKGKVEQRGGKTKNAKGKGKRKSRRKKRTSRGSPS